MHKLLVLQEILSLFFKSRSDTNPASVCLEFGQSRKQQCMDKNPFVVVCECNWKCVASMLPGITRMAEENSE